jgi:periplasmic protein TonB
MKTHISYIIFLITFLWVQPHSQAQIATTGYDFKKKQLKKIRPPQPDHFLSTSDGDALPETESEAASLTYAQFSDNPADLAQFIQKNLHYPALAQEYAVEGAVTIRFLVGEDGSISNIKVQKALGLGCEEEAIRVLQKMPAWQPARLNGVPFAMVKVLRFQFSLR